MKKCFITIFLMLILPATISLQAMTVAASPSPLALPPTLAISEIKITGDEFVILQNNTGKDIADLGSYWLNYFNSYSPLDAGVNSSSQQLPSGVPLAKGQTILLSSNGMATCGASVVSKLSVSLGDSAGFLQVAQMSLSALGITQVPVDFVSWSSGANGTIPSVPSNTKDPKAVYYRVAGASSYGWQLADLDSANACQLNVSGGGTLSTGLTKSSSAVPSIVSVASAATSAGLPDADIGLAAPQISEVLPNPAPPLTDADDEFIELYNSNAQPFDLSGLAIQSGTTTTHKYTFPAGTILQPQQFAAFYATETDLSLSNTSGQVKLLDPAGNVLEQSDVYGTAKDGYAWVYASGLWQWTTTPTPGAKNILTAPPASKTSAKTATTAKVLAAKTSGIGSSGSTFNGASTPTPSKLHPTILAGVGTLAVLYALYEYRHDLANTLYRLRRYREARRNLGPAA